MKDLVQMVKNLAAAKGFIRKKEVRASLDLTTGQVDSAFQNLCELGYLERIERGHYRFIEQVEKNIKDKKEKAWRVMKLRRVFSASDISKRIESTKEYVYKLIRKLHADGYIKPAGVRKTYGSGQEKLWRLTLKGQEKARRPRLETFKSNPLTLKALQLDRLIYSELVLRDRKSADQALALMDEMSEQIRKINAEMGDVEPTHEEIEAEIENLDRSEE